MDIFTLVFFSSRAEVFAILKQVGCKIRRIRLEELQIIPCFTDYLGIKNIIYFCYIFAPYPWNKTSTKKIHCHYNKYWKIRKIRLKKCLTYLEEKVFGNLMRIDIFPEKGRYWRDWRKRSPNVASKKWTNIRSFGLRII